MATSISAAAEAVVSALIYSGGRRATKFIGPNLVVKLTRRQRRSNSFVLTIGKPNFEERNFIKKCRKAKEPLPVRKVQLKDFPKRSKAEGKR